MHNSDSVSNKSVGIVKSLCLKYEQLIQENMKREVYTKNDNKRFTSEIKINFNIAAERNEEINEQKKSILYVTLDDVNNVDDFKEEKLNELKNEFDFMDKTIENTTDEQEKNILCAILDGNININDYEECDNSQTEKLRNELNSIDDTILYIDNNEEPNKNHDSDDSKEEDYKLEQTDNEENICDTCDMLDLQTDNVSESDICSLDRLFSVEDEENLNYNDPITLEKENVRNEYEMNSSLGNIPFIINELIEKEEAYINCLKVIVDEFGPFIEKIWTSGECDLFKNIKIIYENHQEFYEELKLTDKNINKVVQVFLQQEKLFRKYPNYFATKCKTNKEIQQLMPLIKEKEMELNDTLGINSYLLTPMQRLGKYILLLENVAKELKKIQFLTNENLQQAINMLKMYMNEGNNMVAITEIINQPYKYEDFGNFLMRELFEITIQKQKTEMMVHLFENIVIISEIKGPDDYLFYKGIKVADLFPTMNKEGNIITLANFHEYKKDPKNILKLYSKFQDVFEKWSEKINSLMWEQMQKVKEGVSVTTLYSSVEDINDEKQNSTNTSWYIDDNKSDSADLENVTIESLIKNFVDEEVLFLENIVNFHIYLVKTVTDRTTDLIQSMEKYIEFLTKTFYRNLLENKTNVNIFLQSWLNTQNQLEFKNICIEISDFKERQLEPSLTKDLDKINQRIIEYIRFFKMLDSKLEGEQRKRLPKIKLFLKQLMNIKEEKFLRKLISNIVKNFSDFLDRSVSTRKEIELNLKGENSEIQDILSKIDKLENSLNDTLKASLHCYNPQKLAECYINQDELYDMYEAISKISCKLLISSAEYQKEEDLEKYCYSIRIYFSKLINIFIILKDAISTEYDNKILLVLTKLQSRLNKLNLLNNINKIDQLVLLKDAGDIILQNHFKIKQFSRSANESVLFLFEKCIMFTNETRVDNGVSYQVYNSISLKNLQFQNPKENQLKIYSFENQKLKRFCLIIKEGPQHGDIYEWKKTINEFSMKNISQTF